MATDDLIEAKDVLKLAGNVSRATLTRWMDEVWIQKKGLPYPFPSGVLRDGKTKVWDRKTVEAWLDKNAELLGRHRSKAPKPITQNSNISLPLGKALDAVRREMEQDGEVFEERKLIRPLEKALLSVFSQRGVTNVRWNGESFDFSFDDTEEAGHDRVYFALAYS